MLCPKRPQCHGVHRSLPGPGTRATPQGHTQRNDDARAQNSPTSRQRRWQAWTQPHAGEPQATPLQPGAFGVGALPRLCPVGPASLCLSGVPAPPTPGYHGQGPLLPLDRTYAVRRIRDAFRANKDVRDPAEVQALVDKARRDLGVIRRQVHIGELYSAEKLVIEQPQQPRA
ncbi:PREDICTED: LYR motif-containing protein 4 [Condylura cristata]|uniref:LYR motif-containing protein 4 n=1 Tax=Condylura cristata TaxID=143302 RepID=UPI0006439305|nr:PREDICTED: LYR motif-containing protein 4 [Condylura cristata]